MPRLQPQPISTSTASDPSSAPAAPDRGSRGSTLCTARSPRVGLATLLLIAATLLGIDPAPSHAGAAACAGQCLDHFLCYKTKPAKAPKGSPPFPRFAPTSRELSDRLGGPFAYDVKKSLALCLPANKRNEDPTAPAHQGRLVAYQAKRSKAAPKFAAKGAVVEARNQLHPAGLKLKITAEDQLMMATATVVGTNADAGQPPAELADFKCYKVGAAKAPRGQPPFAKFTPVIGISIADELVTRVFDLKKPTRVCQPVLEDGDTPPAIDAVAYLVCYQAKLSKTVPQAKIAKQRLSTNNTLAEEVLETSTPQELCVPSAITPSPADLVHALDDVEIYTRLVNENFPVLLRPAAETYNPEVVALIAQGSAAVDAILARFAGNAEFLDDAPLLLLAYVLEKIGDPRAVPVLADWLERNLFAELIWAPDFVTHTIKVLDGQSGLNTTTFIYDVDQKLDTIAQARSGPPPLARSASPQASASTVERAADPDSPGACDAKIIVTGINAMGQEEDVSLGYKIVARDINDLIATSADPAKHEKWRDTQRSGDSTRYGGTAYAPLPGLDVGFASNCGGSVAERVLNSVAEQRGFPIRLGAGGSDAVSMRNIAKKFGSEVSLAQIDTTTVVSHDTSDGGSAHVEVPISGDASSVLIYSKDNYGIPRTHTVARNGSTPDPFKPVIKAYDSRPWYSPFSTVTTRFYRVDPSRIVGIRLDTSACPCIPNAPNTIPVSIDQPISDTTDQRVITVGGTIGDAQVSFADMKVNGSPQLVGVSSGAFFTTVVLKQGDNKINVNVDTPAGKRGCAERTIKSTAAKTTISATLTWSTDDTDLDLYVTQPDNETAWYLAKNTTIGGQLDVDNTGGLGPENYFLSTEEGDNVLPGAYTIRVHYYSDHEQNDEHPTRVVSWRVVVVVNESTPEEKRQILTGTLGVANSGNDTPGSTGGDWATVTQITVPSN